MLFKVDLASRGIDQLDLTIGDKSSYGVSVGVDKKWFLGHSLLRLTLVIIAMILFS